MDNLNSGGVDTQPVDQTQVFQDFKEALIKFGEIAVATLQPLLQEMVPVLTHLHEAFWQAYREAGMPYGETHEGLLRWVREINEAQRLRQEAQYILIRHRILADFRNQQKEVTIWPEG